MVYIVAVANICFRKGYILTRSCEEQCGIGVGCNRAELTELELL